MTPNIGKQVTQCQTGLEATLDLVDKPREEHDLIVPDFDRLRFAFEDNGHPAGYLWNISSLATELEVARFGGVVQFELSVSHNPKFRNTDSHLRPTVDGEILAVEAGED